MPAWIRTVLDAMTSTVARWAERSFGPPTDDRFAPHEFGAIVDDDEWLERLRRAQAGEGWEYRVHSDDRRIDDMFVAWRNEAGRDLPDVEDDERHRWYPEQG